MQIPVIELELNRPTRSSLTWYAGIGTMAALGAVEWPVATIIAAGHLISQNSRSQAVADAVEGAESAAG